MKSQVDWCNMNIQHQYRSFPYDLGWNSRHSSACETDGLMHRNGTGRDRPWDAKGTMGHGLGLFGPPSALLNPLGGLVIVCIFRSCYSLALHSPLQLCASIFVVINQKELIWTDEKSMRISAQRFSRVKSSVGIPGMAKWPFVPPYLPRDTSSNPPLELKAFHPPGIQSWGLLRRQKQTVTGWWARATPLKNISQFIWLFPIYGKIQNVPNHQPGKELLLFFKGCFWSVWDMVSRMLFACLFPHVSWKSGKHVETVPELKRPNIWVSWNRGTPQSSSISRWDFPL